MKEEERMKNEGRQTKRRSGAGPREQDDSQCMDAICGRDCANEFREFDQPWILAGLMNI